MTFARGVGVDRPRQAVIVAGGRGERLRPLTDTRPKPMIEFHGRPFIDYLLEMLREQGFDRVVLLLGYLADTVVDHVGDGSRYGLDVTYHVTPPELQTGRRMWLARDLVDETFLFMYCDNYWPMDGAAMVERFRQSGAEAMITVYGNADGYSRDNVRVDPETGRVEVYDRSRSAPALRGVELGYAFVSRAVMDRLTGEDVPFEQAVYPALAADGRLHAFVTDHRYYSVGTLERLPQTSEFLARRPTVLLDRDGVLNERAPRAQYVRSPAELRWLDGALEALKLFNESGYRTIVVSNQAGINRGAMTDDDLQAIHARMKSDAAAAGGRIDAFYYCPHDWDEDCRCRKPRPGMLFDAQRDFALDLSRTVFIGDDERDGEAAEAAGAPFLRVTEEISLLDHARAITSDAFSSTSARTQA